MNASVFKLPYEQFTVGLVGLVKGVSIEWWLLPNEKYLATYVHLG